MFIQNVSCLLNMLSIAIYVAGGDSVVLPVPGLSLLRAEGLAALGVFWLAKQDLGVLDQVVDPHGAIGCYTQRPLLVDGGVFRRVFRLRQVVHGQEEPGGRTERQIVLQRDN